MDERAHAVSSTSLQIALIIKFPPPTISSAQPDDTNPSSHFEQAMRSLMWSGEAGGGGGGGGGGGFAGFGGVGGAAGAGTAAGAVWPPGLGPAPGDLRGYVPPPLTPAAAGGGSSGIV